MNYQDSDMYKKAVAAEEHRYRTEGSWVNRSTDGWVPAKPEYPGAFFARYSSIYRSLDHFLVDWCGYEFNEEAIEVLG